MPIYDYACSACHRVTEVIHGINDHGPRFCPECGADGTMTKSFVAPTVHFKGSGWAKKDRGSSARASARKHDEGDSSSDTKSAETKSAETKSASTDGAKSGGTDTTSSAAKPSASPAD
jgi:putative FmdB family regulatory protein